MDDPTGSVPHGASSGRSCDAQRPGVSIRNGSIRNGSIQDTYDKLDGCRRTPERGELVAALTALNARLLLAHPMRRRNEALCSVCFGDIGWNGNVRHDQDCELARLNFAAAVLLAQWSVPERPKPEPLWLPSAADLDAAAEEKAARVATGGRRIVCGMPVPLYGVAGRERLVCDGEPGHAGNHYDGVAQLSWARDCVNVVKHASGLMEYVHMGSERTFVHPAGLTAAARG